jgi:hypothetical protein
VLNIPVIFDTLRVLGDLSDFAFSAHESGLPENAVITEAARTDLATR